MIRLFVVITAIVLAFVDANACDTYVDIVGRGKAQKIQIDKCGIKVEIYVTDEELNEIMKDSESNVMKRVCKVLKCRDVR